METGEGTANPWITVSKRKRSRLSGAQYDAAQEEAAKSEQAVERLPTNGFLNLSLHEPGADEGNGQTSDGAADQNTTRPSSSEGAVPPRKKTKKDAKKVSPPTVKNSFEKPHYPSVRLKDNAANRKVALTDFRDLILWMLDDNSVPEWIEIRHKSHVQACVVLFVPGLSPDLWGIDPSFGSEGKRMRELSQLQHNPLPRFAEIFKYLWIARAPGSNHQLYSSAQAFLNVPLSASQMQARAKEQSKKIGNTVLTESLMMNSADLKEAGYPIHPLHEEGDLDPEYVSTPITLSDPDRVKTFIGLDCEMCRTAVGMEVTRVTLVDYRGETLYDQLVKPDNPITDYLTRWSGITEERLRNTTTSLSTIQKSLIQIIDSDTILVGHSLECDLQALKLAHPHIIDTSVIYQHTRGPPYKPSLKWLAQKWLNRRIQDSREGHDSAEDARACVDLLRLKLQRGHNFGLFNVDVEPLFARLKRRGVESAVIQNAAKNVFYGDRVRMSLQVETDEEVIERVLEALQTDHGFVWGRMTDVETATKWKVNDSLPVPTTELAPALTQFDESIKRLWDALPPCTALMVLSGSGDPRDMVRLHTKKRNWEIAGNEGREKELPEGDRWTDEDAHAYTLALDKAKNGLGFVAIK